MIILYTPEEFSQAKGRDFLKLECYICHKPFFKIKRKILLNLKGYGSPNKFCSLECNRISKITKIKVNCKYCNKEFLKQKNQFEKCPNSFCNNSCSAKYNNAHKTTGYRRSKLELYLEKQLTTIYSDIKFLFNDKTTIKSELDIYIPSLKLAFELNGIFHYEPIYGQDKLNQIQSNDKRKFQACLENGIELCIIDASGLKYFKEDKAKKYLDIVDNIIKLKLI